MRTTSITTHFVLTAILLAVPGLGAGPAEAPRKDDESALDRLWSFATLHKDPGHPILQEFKLRGLYHGQHWALDSQQGNDRQWENRRLEAGIEAQLFRHFTLRLEAQSTGNFQPIYEGLVDAYVRWKPSEAFALTVGKQKPQIAGFDWLDSVRSQPTFERSQIFNQFRVQRTLGAVATGEIGNWTYQTGIYSNDTDREFGQLAGGWSLSAGFGYDFKEKFGMEKADLRLDWLHSEIEAEDTILNRYEDVFSSTLWLRNGRWSFVAEGFYATGRSPGVFGFFLLPTYELLPKRLQLVGRYTFSAGNGPDSVIAQSRYEREASFLGNGGRGNRYHAGYVGLQYFLHGDRLKIMAGAEYAHLEGGDGGGDFEGVTILSGLRIAF